MKRELTCIVCPIGCTLSVDIADGKVNDVNGNACPRGKKYAETECVSPMRVLTTTVRSAEGRLVPIKTDKAIPKDRLFEAMKIINNARPHLPIHIGDVIIEDVFGARVVVTKNVEISE
jgi:CxxC motif-containing protein